MTQSYITLDEELARWVAAKRLGRSDVMSDYNKYWVVLREDGATSGRLKLHSSLVSAEKEAARLAQQEQRLFFVMEAVSGYEPAEPPIRKIQYSTPY